MNFTTFFTKEGVKAFWHDISFKANDAKPEIFLIGGGLSLLAGTIIACYKTEKAKLVLEEHKEAACKAEVAKTEALVAAGNDEKAIKQAKFDAGKAQVKLYLTLTYKLLGVYGLPALLWLGGFGLIADGHIQLRHRNAALAGQLAATTKLLQDNYREQNMILKENGVVEAPAAQINGENQEEMIEVIQIDPLTGKEIGSVMKPMSCYTHQPGSIFARNFTPTTSDCFDIEYFAENFLNARIEAMNNRLDCGSPRCYTGLDVYKTLGYDENALGEDEYYDALLENGISANGRKVPDPEQRKIKFQILEGLERRYDEGRGKFVYYPCYRLDWNFYPLHGRV